MRLSWAHRTAWYAVAGTLLVTGVAWLVADRMKTSPAHEIWQQSAATLLMVHGGAAMLALLLLGALAQVHVQRAWRSRRNRISGVAMVIINSILMLTAFGLYYSGSDVLRPWISDLHTGCGLFLPLLVAVHVLIGRRSR